ncbi:threonine aldolase [Galliscardovia ingluviei]|uniref:Threonine aldolase n=1 Tax=Galliscardovia ingluviei TaxID=1769422 RepID=A0A8J3EXJ9_9BIFI|nr:aminotransferase class I/II-fold pyridoxal phosphate-dependent enzyme [Galliscardovia ingluviei]GGI13252.1 threonine aldolase [Galliscardovia ingluviei]
MLHFESDYTMSAHPAILQALQASSQEHYAGYGLDTVSQEAQDRIRAATLNPDADIHFVAGGTQANKIVIASLLRAFEGVVATDSAHIATHEAGAIESSSHKVLTTPQVNGKLTSEALQQVLDSWENDDNRDHMVRPGMVYISHPTEFGTLYSRSELATLHSICLKHHIPLFVDGARLGYGLAAKSTDVTLPDLAQYADVFTIGGTKMGALFGEAIVLRHRDMIASFFSQIKLHGALLAKGWLLGLQFNTLFNDNLYWNIGEYADHLAMQIHDTAASKGYSFMVDSPTNQQFFTVDHQTIERLSQYMPVAVWQQRENQFDIRIATSWSTTQDDVDQLLTLL